MSCAGPVSPVRTSGSAPRTSHATGAGWSSRSGRPGGAAIEPLGPLTEPPRRPSYYQRRIEGPSLAAIYLGDRSSARLGGVTLQEVGRPGAPFAYAGSLGPWPLAPIILGRLEALGTTLAAAFGLAGLFGVDFILRDGQPWPVEVNPRYTASVEVLELALGRTLLADHARGFSIVDSRNRGLGRGEATSGSESSTQRARSGSRTASAVPLFRSPSRFPRLGDVPCPGTSFLPGTPVLTVFAHGSSLEACRRRLERKTASWEAPAFRGWISGPVGCVKHARSSSRKTMVCFTHPAK